MSKRKRFSRNSVASSRGNYVRMSHFKQLQEGLEERGYQEDLRDIAEVSISVVIERPQRYAVKIFGKLIQISEDEAKNLSPEFVIKL